MPLRKADITAVRKFEDGDAWLVLRTKLTKGESDAVRDLAASYTINPDEIADASPEQAMEIEVRNRTAQANAALFEILCQSWSAADENGAAIPISQQAYTELDEESGRWVDSCIQKVLRERRERAEKNAPSSPRPRKRATSSARAAA